MCYPACRCRVTCSSRFCEGVTLTTHKAPGVVASDPTPRGYSCDDTEDYSECAHFIATPTVVEAARAFYGCGSLLGMELENQDSDTCPFSGMRLDLGM